MVLGYGGTGRRRARFPHSSVLTKAIAPDMALRLIGGMRENASL